MSANSSGNINEQRVIGYMDIEKNFNLQETPENSSHPIKKFWDNHKKGILIGTSVVLVIGGSAIATAIGMKKHREAFDVDRTLKNASLDELKEAIEITQTEYFNHTENDDFREDLIKMIKLMNKEASKRE